MSKLPALMMERIDFFAQVWHLLQEKKSHQNAWYLKPSTRRKSKTAAYKQETESQETHWDIRKLASKKKRTKPYPEYTTHIGILAAELSNNPMHPAKHVSVCSLKSGKGRWGDKEIMGTIKSMEREGILAKDKQPKIWLIRVVSIKASDRH